MNDEEWVNPPEPTAFRATCRNCDHFHVCPCDSHGLCDVTWDFYDPDEELVIPRDCDRFDAIGDFAAEREAALGDLLQDLAKDRRKEEG